MANSKTFPIFSGSLSFSGHFHFRKNRVYNNNNTAFSLDVSIFSFSFVFPYAKSSGICSPLNGATRRKNHFVFGRNETLFGSPAEDMGTGGKTFDAHVIPATYHHKHVRPMAGDDSDLRRGIGELLSRWGGLQMAVKNKWGGNDSLEKSQELAHHLFHLLSQTNGSFCFSLIFKCSVY